MKPNDIAFQFDNLGKPRLTPTLNAADIRFNVTHSGDLALIAITRGCEVGIDIERIRDVGQLAQIAARFFHPEESAAIAAAPPNEQREVFLRCWTAKEAILKACGKGITAELHTFAVPLATEYEGWFELPRSKNSATGVRYWLQRFVPREGYLAAAAFMGKQRRASYYSFQNLTNTTEAVQ